MILIDLQNNSSENRSHKNGPIGIFDSGRGGYYTMQEIKKLLPKYDYLFYGDTIHMPYGDKNSEQIREYTFAGLQWLFDHGCKIVIIACNTAAAYSIRDRQNKYPDLKTLSVTIPGIQALDSHRVRSALFLSTIATAHSGILPDLVEKYHYTGDIRIQSCAGLADFIEQDHKSSLTYNQKKDIVWHCVGEVQEESIVLACTHYGVRYDIFERLYPNQTIIDPSQESAKMLVHYLLRHPEIEQSLTKGGNIEEYWTG